MREPRQKEFKQLARRVRLASSKAEIWTWAVPPEAHPAPGPRPDSLSDSPPRYFHGKPMAVLLASPVLGLECKPKGKPGDCGSLEGGVRTQPEGEASRCIYTDLQLKENMDTIKRGFYLKKKKKERTNRKCPETINDFKTDRFKHSCCGSSVTAVGRVWSLAQCSGLKDPAEQLWLRFKFLVQELPYARGATIKKKRKRKKTCSEKSHQIKR